MMGLAPLVLQAIKVILLGTEELSVKNSFTKMRDANISVYQKMLESDDTKEGPIASTEKRKPNWTGK